MEITWTQKKISSRWDLNPPTLHDLARYSYHWATGDSRVSIESLVARYSYHWATGDSRVSIESLVARCSYHWATGDSRVSIESLVAQWLDQGG